MPDNDLFLDGTRRLRTGWRFSIFAVGFVVSQILAAIPVAAAMFVYLAQTNSLGDLPAILRMAESPPLWLMCVAAIPTTAAALGLVWLCRRFLDQPRSTS